MFSNLYYMQGESAYDDGAIGKVEMILLKKNSIQLQHHVEYRLHRNKVETKF